MQSKTDSTAFIHYKLQGRRPSIVTLKDTATSNTSEFSYKELIIDRKYCKIRLFSNASGETIVIKSPQSNITKSSFETENAFNEKVTAEEEDITNEFNLLKKAYPNDAPYGLDVGPYIYPNEVIWSYRLVMPHITEQTFNKFASTSQSNNVLLLFFMAIAIELECIHQRGVIHGDVKGDNGFVKYDAENNRFDIHFIDFGCAYLVNGAKAVTTLETGSHTRFWAPERRVCLDKDSKRPYVSPDVKQDVYSYGYMLLGFMQMIPTFKELHPKLVSTIEATQNKDPNERPELTAIISQMKSM